MKLTNKLGLPEPIVRAVANDDYDRGGADISVSQLGEPPRLVALQEKHNAEIETDASEEIWALLGKAVHTILERAEMNELAELRLSMQVNGWTVSGKFDRLVLRDGALEDYKITSAYVVKKRMPGERARVDDWEQALNSYAELVTQHGGEVKKLRIVAILRDWSKLEALRDRDYPQRQVVVIELPLWPASRRREWIEGRVRLHQAARQSLPFCNDEDRWKKPTTYALMKKGRQSALKVEKSMRDLLRWADMKGHLEPTTMVQGGAEDQLKPGLSFEQRPGKCVRCESYCSVAAFCDQWRDDPLNPANAKPSQEAA